MDGHVRGGGAQPPVHRARPGHRDGGCLMSPVQFVADLFNPDLAFLGKALLIAVMSATVCGVVGCYVVLRGMAFIGDAVAHAVFPGLAVAFVISGNLVLGGTVAGVLTAVLVA